MENVSKYFMMIIISFMMIKLLETLKMYDENAFPFNQVFTGSTKKRNTFHSRLINIG